MGQSTDGQLCFGIPFPEGFQFPWEDDSGDEEDWWLKVNGYKEPFKLYSDDGQGYAPGIRTVKGSYGRVDVAPEDAHLVDEYYEHKRKFKEEHPFPVGVINYCSGDCPMYMLCVKGTLKSNRRGYPEEINPSELVVTEEQKQSLLDFCNKYLAEAISAHNDEEYTSEKITLEPKWYLTSYWG